MVIRYTGAEDELHGLVVCQVSDLLVSKPSNIRRAVNFVKNKNVTKGGALQHFSTGESSPCNSFTGITIRKGE